MPMKIISRAHALWDRLTKREAKPAERPVISSPVLIGATVFPDLGRDRVQVFVTPPTPHISRAPVAPSTPSRWLSTRDMLHTLQLADELAAYFGEQDYTDTASESASEYSEESIIDEAFSTIRLHPTVPLRLSRPEAWPPPALRGGAKLSVLFE